MRLTICDRCRHEVTPEMGYRTPAGQPKYYNLCSDEPPGQEVKVEIRVESYSGQDYCLPCIKELVGDLLPRKYA